MSDPIDKLTDFGTSFEGGPMPASAAEVRRRGDRIRRRTHALIAAGAAVVVAAVAVPVIALTNGLGDDAVDPAPAPPKTSLSDGADAGGLDEANLLTDGDTVADPGLVWTGGDPIPDDGQSVFNPCAQSALADLGASSVLQRDFTLSAEEGGEGAAAYLNEIIGEFGSAEAAQEAAATIEGWFEDCLPGGAETFDGGAFAPVPIPVAGEARSMAASFGPVVSDDGPRGFPYDDEDGAFDWHLVTGIVVSGDRIAVLSDLRAVRSGEPVDGTAVDQMLPTAAERLVAGDGSEPTQPDATDPTGTDGGAPAAVTAIPPDFPLTAGMPDESGNSDYTLDPPSIDNQAIVPAGEVEACGVTPETGDPVDRLTTRLTGPADLRTREIVLFATDAEAATYVEKVRAVYASCPEEPVDGLPENWVTTVTDAVYGTDDSLVAAGQLESGSNFRSVVSVVLVGNAVLGEAVNDEGGVADDLADEVGPQLDEVIDTMVDLFGGETTTGGGQVLGPDGFGDLTIGMSRAELEATGASLEDTGAPCATFQLPGFPPRANQTDGFLTDANGLESIFARPGVTTPEGIGPGSTRAEVEAAYGDLGAGAMVTTPAGDGTVYQLGFNGSGTVESLTLMITDQSCFG